MELSTTESSPVIAIEVPFAVSQSSIANAVERLGGRDAVKKFSISPEEGSLNLKFRPSDPFSHPVHSCCVKSNDWLVKLRLPKRTADLPLSQRLKKLDHAPEFSLIGKIQNVVRFRDLVDFQWLKQEDSFGKNLHAMMGSMDCS